MSRSIFPLNQRWLYHQGFVPEHREKLCKEEGFAEITLPHTNHIVPFSGFDDRDYQFVSSYRRHFRLPKQHQGKQVRVEFDGAMSAAKVFLNGHFIKEHKGGYTPFQANLEAHLEWEEDNVLMVELDSTERPDIPPFGGLMDYLTFGGIYREARLQVLDPLFIENVFVKPRGVLSSRPQLEVLCFLENRTSEEQEVQIRVHIGRDEGTPMEGREDICIPAGARETKVVRIPDCSALERWEVERPVLHQAVVTLTRNGCEIDSFETRFGLRECSFRPEGFLLNGKKIHLRGLNRHQTFPWVGAAMPARVQRRDADILKNEFKINIVRTSHYPQSPHFLDRCDEIGLLVFEEIPGWQHIGDQAWQDVSVQNVEEMIRRDWNHPSIVLWGTRINESQDNDEFYTRTNARAKQLDDTRQTGGVRYLLESHLIEDVFTYNDFDPEELKTPVHPLHLVTEYCGHMYSTKHFDNTDRLTEHTRRHAHIQSQAAVKPGIAGAIGWCAFDYNTHKDFGSGDRICHHGVADMFRIPKFAAGVYRAQCPPQEEIVLEPAFHWCLGDRAGAGGIGQAIINSNCDSLVLFLGPERMCELLPDRERFPGLPHPPFFIGKEMEWIWGEQWHPLRIDGYLAGRKVISREFSETGVDAQFLMTADSAELVGDGSDATRAWFMVADEFGNHRNFAAGSIRFEIEGPGEIIGDNPFALIGGCGAIWVRAKTSEGTILLRGIHPRLGEKTVAIGIKQAWQDPV